MTNGYQIRDQYALHFLTFATIQWVDVFTRSCYAEIMLESLRYCRAQKSLLLKSYCIMPNHVHLLARASGEPGLSDILRDMKKFTSKKILKEIAANPKESRRNWMSWLFRSAGQCNSRNNDNQFWQQENHPVECISDEMFQSKLKYIHENPVRAGLVWNPEDYRYSSATDYLTDRKGLIEIDW